MMHTGQLQNFSGVCGLMFRVNDNFDFDYVCPTVKSNIPVYLNIVFGLYPKKYTIIKKEIEYRFLVRKKEVDILQVIPNLMINL